MVLMTAFPEQLLKAFLASILTLLPLPYFSAHCFFVFLIFSHLSFTLEITLMPMSARKEAESLWGAN